MILFGSIVGRVVERGIYFRMRESSRGVSIVRIWIGFFLLNLVNIF